MPKSGSIGRTNLPPPRMVDSDESEEGQPESTGPGRPVGGEELSLHVRVKEGDDYEADLEDDDVYDCPTLHLNVTFNADDEVFDDENFPTTPFEYSSDDENNNGHSVIDHIGDESGDESEIFLDDACSDENGDHIVTSSSFCYPDTDSSHGNYSSDNEVDSDVLYSDEEHKKNTRRKRESLKNNITIDGKTFAECVEEFKDVSVSSGSDEEPGGFFMMRSESFWELLNPFPKSVSL